MMNDLVKFLYDPPGSIRGVTGRPLKSILAVQLLTLPLTASRTNIMTCRGLPLVVSTSTVNLFTSGRQYRMNISVAMLWMQLLAL